MMRRLATGIVCIATMTAVLSAAAPSVGACPSGPVKSPERGVSSALVGLTDEEQAALSRHSAAFGTNSDDLSDFYTWTHSLPGIEADGYVGSVNDADTRSVQILWTGQSPVRQQVAMEAQRRQIDISFTERQYSMKDLSDGRDAVLAFIQNHPELNVTAELRRTLTVSLSRFEGHRRSEQP